MADEVLSARKLRAITALMEHTRHDMAAAAADVPVRTLRTWQTEPAFKAELARRGSDMLRDASRVLQVGATKAAQSLCDMASGEKEATTPRIAASRAVLELAAKLTELCDLEGRMRALETAAATAGDTVQGVR